LANIITYQIETAPCQYSLASASEQNEGVLTLNGISKGVYSITWWKTTTGEVLSRRVESTKDDILTILTPRINKSAVAKIIRLHS